ENPGVGGVPRGTRSPITRAPRTRSASIPRAPMDKGRQASGSEAMFFRKKQSLVGLDIGSYSVKVVEIESLPGGGHRLVHYVISDPLSEAMVDGEIMDRQLVTDAIANLLESRGVKTKSVVAAVSGRAVIVKKIAMNKLSTEDAQQAIVWEAEQHVPYDINDVS